MKKLAFLFFALIALVACEEDNDVTVTINESGDLKVNVFDLSEEGFAGATIQVNRYNGDNYYTVFTDSTKSNGECVFNDVLQDEYRVYVLATDEQDRVYGESQLIQVIAGKEKTLEMNPFMLSGEVSLQFMDNEENPYINLNVALLPYNYYQGEDNTHEEFLEDAYYTGSTNTQGEVTFNNVPYRGLNYAYQYTVYVYTDESQARYFSNDFYVNPRGTYSKTYQFNF